MKKQFLEVGEVVTTHALGGELRVYPWCDTPAFLTGFEKLYLNEGKESLDVERAKVHKNIVLVKFKGIDSVEAAMKLRKKVLYIDRNDVELEEGAYFVQDLLGLEVYDAVTGDLYGELVDVSQTGANDVYHIKWNKGQFMIPAVPSVVLKTDIENNRMEIRMLDGLFEATGKGGGPRED